MTIATLITINNLLEEKRAAAESAREIAYEAWRQAAPAGGWEQEPPETAKLHATYRDMCELCTALFNALEEFQGKDWN